ncbi:MAG: Mrp/NBP35 family ATP-binding protein [Chloroflexi bacterium]|nr:Mrp/NBP35 family ATP-binding protein [Chloroflexota bacterium]
MNTQEQEVLAALATVKDPDLNRDLVALNMIRDVRIRNGTVEFTLVLTTPADPFKHELREAAQRAVRQLSWVKDVRPTITAQTVSARGIGTRSELIPRVKNVIAVASGKGGVGKSTTSVNTALALAETGARVGLLDADIYGPNIPLMMGLKERPPLLGEEGRIVPPVRYGIKLMSIGFFLEEDNPVIWRGPMVHGAIQQFLRDVDWGELDYMVVDLPPGTGDAPLSLAQMVPMSGVVVVTTPQDVAIQDVAKGLAMFKKLEVPIVGVVENMSYFICNTCGTQHELFGRGGGERIAGAFNVPFLGKIPLQPDIRHGGDEGRPYILTHPRAPESDAYRLMVGSLVRQLKVMALASKPAAGFVSLDEL